MKFFKTPRLFIFLFSKWIWRFNILSKKVFLTFDDGPTPEITEWILNELNKRKLKATFFCLGKNIQNHPTIFNYIKHEGHQIGNHTFNHLNGWKTSLKAYLQDIQLCQKTLSKNHCNSNLFRPPYGKISLRQAFILRKFGFKIIMWDVLSRDFDNTLSAQKCYDAVINNIENGSIIVFHDSEKAFPILKEILPKILDFLIKNQYQCCTIS